MIIFIVFTDDDLEKIRKRDPVIFENIFKEYNKKIYNYLVVKTNGNVDMAKDVFSETFYSAVLYAPKLKEITNIQGWLIKIANNKLIDTFRKQSKENKYVESYPHEEYHDDYPDDAMYKNEKKALFDIAMKNIKPKYNEILKLKYIENKSLNEIVQILNKSVKSAESLLFRAREALKNELIKLVKDI